MSNKPFSVGARCMYRTIFGNSFTCYVRKEFLFFRLIQWTRVESWGPGDEDEYQKMAWRPVWRLV